MRASSANTLPRQFFTHKQTLFLLNRFGWVKSYDVWNQIQSLTQFSFFSLCLYFQRVNFFAAIVFFEDFFMRKKSNGFQSFHRTSKVNSFNFIIFTVYFYNDEEFHFIQMIWNMRLKISFVSEYLHIYRYLFS